MDYSPKARYALKKAAEGCCSKEWVKLDTGLRPPPFRLQYLKLDDERIIPGWWTGTGWDGRRIKKENNILEFKDGGG